MDDVVRQWVLTCPLTFGGSVVGVIAFGYWFGHWVGYRKMERTYDRIMEAELRAVEAELNAAGVSNGGTEDYDGS